MTGHPHPTLSTDLAHNLMLAVIASSTAPLVLLDGDFTVISASTSFCIAFRIEPDGVTGSSLFEIGDGEWNLPQLRSLLMATADGHAEITAYEMDLEHAGQKNRRLVLNARKLAYAYGDQIRILLSITDVTDARHLEKLKDEALKENEVLLQEIQHRVANSLQIIASVLMQSARKVQSDETRTHLQAAHHRVMSVAALQKQLATSNSSDVNLRTYFTALCKSISASMIHDQDRLSLTVDVDESITRAGISISLGLIATELVINALKHAFPGDRGGTITVGYHGEKSGWTLWVRDNGVGMPEPGTTESGLGTSMVTALSKQLQATVVVSDGRPGTVVSISHVQADVDNYLNRAMAEQAV